MRYLISLPFFLFFTQSLLAQNGVIHLENPSFEGVPGESVKDNLFPKGWQDCGFKGETPPDVHPIEGGGTFQVTQEPVDGDTYIGMVVRENDTWEMVGQQLSSPMQAGSNYNFSIYLCRSKIYLGNSRVSGMQINYAAPIMLRIWGGNDDCDRKELLATSGLVVNTDWEEYEFQFSPTKNFTHIIFEAFYKVPTKFLYNGNLLMDMASDIIAQ